MYPALGSLVSPDHELRRLRARVKRAEQQAQALEASDRELAGAMEGLIDGLNGLTRQAPKSDVAESRGSVAEPLVLTRSQVAQRLQISTRQVQRLEAQGKLTRCPHYGTAVRYPTSDVLKLASARL